MCYAALVEGRGISFGKNDCMAVKSCTVMALVGVGGQPSGCGMIMLI
jgi:hypothetical protein